MIRKYIIFCIPYQLLFSFSGDVGGKGTYSGRTVVITSPPWGVLTESQKGGSTVAHDVALDSTKIGTWASSMNSVTPATTMVLLNLPVASVDTYKMAFENNGWVLMVHPITFVNMGGIRMKTFEQFNPVNNTYHWYCFYKSGTSKPYRTALDSQLEDLDVGQRNRLFLTGYASSKFKVLPTMRARVPYQVAAREFLIKLKEDDPEAFSEEIMTDADNKLCKKKKDPGKEPSESPRKKGSSQANRPIFRREQLPVAMLSQLIASFGRASGEGVCRFVFC